MVRVSPSEVAMTIELCAYYMVHRWPSSRSSRLGDGGATQAMRRSREGALSYRAARSVPPMELDILPVRTSRKKTRAVPSLWSLDCRSASRSSPSLSRVGVQVTSFLDKVGFVGRGPL